MRKPKTLNDELNQAASLIDRIFEDIFEEWENEEAVVDAGRDTPQSERVN